MKQFKYILQYILQYILTCMALSFFMSALMFETILLKESVWICLTWLVLLYPLLKLIQLTSNNIEQKKNTYKGKLK